MAFRSTPLFGGAIVADLPTTFQDVSDIRQVPDTQEIYLSSTGYTSILFDILERVTEPAGDLEALNFHLSDIVDEDAKDVEIVESGREVQMAGLPGVKAYALHAKAPPGEKQRGRAHEPSSVGILMLLVRLERLTTDLVITVNVPCGIVDDHVEGRGSDETLLQEGKEILERVRASLGVVEWGLFGEE